MTCCSAGVGQCPQAVDGVADQGAPRRPVQQVQQHTPAGARERRGDAEQSVLQLFRFPPAGLVAGQGDAVEVGHLTTVGTEGATPEGTANAARQWIRAR